MPNDPSDNPSFEKLQLKGQGLLSEFAALHEAMVKEIAGHQEKLKLHEAEKKELADRLRTLTADNDALQAYQLQWAVEREEQLKGKKAAEARHAQLEKELRAVGEANESLKLLHGQVAEQAQRLAAEWNARRQSFSADTQRLRTELEEVRKALQLSQQREKQWQAQAFKLQDELRALRDAAGRMTLTDEQSHHLLSQLNAIIGFAEVLLDEAGNRATATERQEFLHDIKDSGDHLADYVHQLTSPAADANPPVAPTSPAEAVTPARQSAGRTILVAATDPVVRERCQTFLGRASYQVEFANDADEAVAMALRLQPLAIMVDTDVPPKGAEPLVDALLREPRARDIPVVLAVKNEDEPSGLSLGSYDFLTKPINRQQLLQLMIKYDMLADRRRAAKMPASVLVIDDDARNTRLVKAMLKPQNVTVLEADGGAMGIKLALKHKPDLVILDLMMPEVDGFQVVTALKNDASTSQIPILIYTAKNVTAADRQTLQDSIQSIVRKGDLSKQQFLDLVYKRGERRNRPSERAA